MQPPPLLPLLQLLQLLLLSVSDGRSECPNVLAAPPRRPLSSSALLSLAQGSSADELHSITQPILVERPVGSKQHKEVRDYIADWMRKLGWKVEFEESLQLTPIGQRKFVNIVATAPQAAGSWVVLSAHYDSKLMPGFIGATDSAVPCGMLLQLASALTSHLPGSASVGLKLVFFDGEEAFVEWSNTDSIYGARSLAARMEAQAGSAGCNSAIKEIDTLMLLDLIGFPGSTFSYHSHFGSAEVVSKEKSLFLRLVRAEQQLRAGGSISSSSPHYFSTAIGHSRIEDDHLPFRERGVPVLHVIATPFPRVWHRLSDNATFINWDQAREIGLVTQVWTAEYLGLQL